MEKALYKCTTLLYFHIIPGRALKMVRSICYHRWGISDSPRGGSVAYRSKLGRSGSMTVFQGWFHTMIFAEYSIDFSGLLIFTCLKEKVLQYAIIDSNSIKIEKL